MTGHERKMVDVTDGPITVEQVARIFRVPPWLISSDFPQPSWRQRPLWRLRALCWRWLS